MKKMPLISVGGFLVIAIYLICLLVSSMFYSGPYSPFDNWLSDLGNSTYNPTGYFYYNIGCILTGVALFISVLGLARWKTGNRKRDKLIMLSQYCGYFMAFALIMVGVFSEDYGTIHVMWSTVFFVLLFIFMTLTNIALKNHAGYMTGIWHYSIVAILLDLIFVFTVFRGLLIPILEWLAVFGGLVWLGLIGYNTLKLEAESSQYPVMPSLTTSCIWEY